MNPSFQLNSVFVFCLQVEENSTEGKSKDGAPLDSQSEGTNYFLQYIATPRWWSILLFWLVLAFLLHSQFPSTNSSYLFILFCCCSFSSKNAANSAAGEAKFVFGQNMSERVLVSGKIIQNPNPVKLVHRLDSFSKVVLCCAFRVLQRASAQMRNIKKLQLHQLQSPHHRKAPKRRVSTQEGVMNCP